MEMLYSTVVQPPFLKGNFCSSKIGPFHFHDFTPVFEKNTEQILPDKLIF